jgi:hypothetical protein
MAQVIRAANRANDGPLKLAEMRGEWPAPRRAKAAQEGKVLEDRPGQAVADRLKRMAAERGPDARMRRLPRRR